MKVKEMKVTHYVNITLKLWTRLSDNANTKYNLYRFTVGRGLIVMVIIIVITITITITIIIIIVITIIAFITGSSLT